MTADFWRLCSGRLRYITLEIVEVRTSRKPSDYKQNHKQSEILETCCRDNRHQQYGLARAVGVTLGTQMGTWRATNSL
ncbi:MAG: hypothetical protein IPO08_24855 [Xanthomonadales bacterium]|nr:hypothetical protein [Xanthomonadales bacterium]